MQYSEVRTHGGLETHARMLESSIKIAEIPGAQPKIHRVLCIPPCLAGRAWERPLYVDMQTLLSIRLLMSLYHNVQTYWSD